jgi:hypothetical protein
MSEERQSGTWGRAASSGWRNLEDGRQALAAALPPLIFGLAIVAMFLIIVPLDRVVIGGPSRVAGLYAPSLRLTVGLGVGLAMGGVLVIGGLVAAVRRLPAWGYTWVGAGLMGLFLLLVLLGDDREFLISPAADVAVVALFLLAGLAALGAAALRGWRQAGLLSLGLSATLGLSLCFWVVAGPFNRLDLALLAGPLGLLVAALTYAYARGADLTRVAALLGAGLTNAGLAWMAARVWQPWFHARGGLSAAWPLLAIATAILLAGPLLGLLGRPLRRALGWR